MAEDNDVIERPASSQSESSVEGRYSLDRRTVSAILDAVEAGDAALLTELMEPLHAADIADFWSRSTARTAAP